MCHVLILVSGEAVSGAENNEEEEKELIEEIKEMPNVRNVFLDTPVGPGIKQLMVVLSEDPRDIADAIEEIKEKGEEIKNPKEFNIRDWITKKISDAIREIMGENAVLEIKILENL